MEKINFLDKIPMYVQKSDEWINQRKGKLTSSDAGTALGMSPYTKSYELLLQKAGAPYEFKGSVNTWHGEKFESEAIDKYSQIYLKENHEYGLVSYSDLDPIRTKKYNYDLSFLAGSPDGVARDIETDELILLEVKCPPGRKLKSGYCPAHYYAQVQLNMLILDLQKADYIEYVPANEPPQYLPTTKWNIMRIYRNENWLEQNIPKLIKFWQDVQYWKQKGPIFHPMYEKYINKINKNNTNNEK